MDLEGASSSRELKYLKDIRIVFQGIFNSDPDALGEQSSINSADAVYHYVGRVDRLFSVQNCTLRVDGMIKALKSVEAVVEQAEVFTREEQAEWPSMIWGPMALALQRSYTSYSASDQILAVLEDLTTLSCLPVPPIAWNAEKSPYLADALLHLFAELSCGLGQFVSFLRQFEHEAHLQSDHFAKFESQHKMNVLRLRSWSTRVKEHRHGNSTTPTPSSSLDQPHRHIPVYVSKNFHGREDYLRTMHESLLKAEEQPAVLSLHGLPGIGKTQLTARYCKAYGSDYRVILWVQADTPTKISHSCSKYSVSLKLDGAEPRGDESTNVAILISWLQATSDPWLIVFDNVDDVEILPDYWPTGGTGHMIITSRDPYTGDFRTSASIHVLPLDKKDSQELFYKVIGQGKNVEHNRNIEELLYEWKGVPLALNQIGSYVQRAQLDLEKFVRLYAKEAPRIHRVKDLYDEYPHSIATAFSVRQLDSDAKAILQAMCFFDPDKIPNELIESSLERSSFNSIVSEFDYLNGLNTLRKRSLLEQSHEDLSIHRLVQSVVFSDMNRDERSKAFNSALRVLVDGFPREIQGRPMWNEWNKCGRYLPHVLFLCNKYIKDNAKDSECPDLAELLSSCTWYMFERGYFSQAEQLLATAQRACPNSDNPVVATILFNLAGIRCECNRIAEAKALCYRALKIREAVLSHDDPQLGNTYYSMGIVHMENGELGKSLEFNKKAVRLRKICRDVDAAPTAFSYANLALCYQNMNELSKASKYLEKAEALWRQAYGTQSDKYAQVMYHLGNLRLAQNREKEAFRMHEKALDICRKILPNHDKTGYSFHKLAMLYHRQGRHEEAIDYLQRAIAIFEKNFDPNPRIARSTYKMCEIYEDMGRSDEALRKRQQARDIRKTIWTFPYNPDETAEAYDSLIPSFLR